MSISNTVNFLPPYLQTVANKRFLGATLDLLTKSPALTRFDGFIGRQVYNGEVLSGNYLLEGTPVRQNYQLEAAFVTRDSNQNIVEVSNFLDLLNASANLDAVTAAWNRLLTNNLYSWQGFTNLDKIINYQNYCWLSTSGNDWYWDTSILLSPTSTVADDILGQTEYTDPSGVTLLDGIIVSFPATQEVPYNTGTYIVQGVGQEITLVPSTNIITPAFVADQNNPPDYITIARNAVDLNLWSRTNLWVHKNTVDSIITTLTAQDANFAVPTEFTLAHRPIIEFAPLVLFDSGKIGLPATSLFDDATTDAFYIVQGQPSFVVDGVQLNDGDSVIFNADHNPVVRENIYDVNFVDTSLITQIPRLYPVQAIATTNIPLYGPATIDGYITNVGDRILVIGQYNAVQNGIYIVSNSNWALAPDFVPEGQFGVLVLYGILYKNTYVIYTALTDSTASVQVSGQLIGAQDGVNNVFTLPVTPYPNSLLVWDNFPLIPEVGYTVSGSTVTFTNPPATTDTLFFQCLLITATPINTPSAGTLTGTQDGTNKVFTIPVTPYPNTLLVWDNYPLVNGVGYTISGNTITFTTAPATTDNLFFQCQADNDTPPVIPIAGPIIGVQNSINTTFTMPAMNGVIPDLNTLLVWQNYPLVNGIGYTVVGDTIIFTTPPAPTDTLHFQTLPSDWSIRNAPVIQLTLRDTAQPENCSLITQGTVYADQMMVWNPSVWTPAAQNKTGINQAPFFDVFDLNGVSFGNSSVYIDTSFTGSELFSYEVGTGPNDPVLGFPLTYGPVGNLNDVIFASNYATDTFSYSGITSTQPVLSGRAHLIDPLTDVENVFDAWQYVDCNLELYQNIVTVGNSTVTFGGNLLVKSTPNSQKPQMYIDGVQVAPSDFTVTQNANNTITVSTTSNVANTSSIVIKVLSSTPIPGAWYDVPPAFDHNPLGTWLSTFNMGELRQHATVSQENTNDTTGIIDLFLDEYQGVPGSILFQEAIAMLPTLLLCNNQFNIDQALRTAGEDYVLFQQRFINTATQLPNLASIPAKQAVDQILQKIAGSFISGQPWATSDMCYWGGTPINVTVTNPSANKFNLKQTYNFTQPNLKELQVYLNQQQLIRNIDYTVVGSTLTITRLLNVGDSIAIYEIANTTGSYIPATPTKLGLANAYVPQIYTDYTYQTPRQMIQGHDGSTTTCYGDYRDNLILDYELRVYNNLKVNSQFLYDTIQSHVPDGGRWRLEQASTNASIAPYTPSELLTVQQRMFYEWAAEYNVNYQNSFYDADDLFTWNWSSSLDKLSDQLPLLGYWRGIYRWFYDTENVNTRPWEALGLAIKPSWWDTTYGPAPYTGGNEVLWYDIAAGIIRDPAGTRLSTFGQKTFGSNTVLSVIPVDESGNLLDPNESVVGVFNNSAAQNDFVFGDDGPSEEAWRRSSMFPYARLRAQILQNPLFMCGTLWDTNNYLPTVGYNEFRYQGNFLGSISDVTLNSVDDNGTALVNSLLNYSIEYMRRQGQNPSALRTAISGTGVQLMYPLGGFSSAADLTAFGDPNNPADVGAAELIPVQDYTLFLNQSTPTGTLNYSGVIINASGSGYQISGYNRVDPFFTIYNPNTIGAFSQIGVAPNFYKYPKTFANTTSVVPYNTIFPNVQAVINFLAGYEKFLVTNGLNFTTNTPQTQVTWQIAAVQFIKWSLTNWGTSVPLSIVLNPSSSIIEYNATSGTLYDLTNPLTSLVLDVNGSVVTQQYLDVYRDLNSVTITHQGGGIFGCISADIVSYDHRVVFDNLTAFDDTIYDPVSAIRQTRLTFSGQKSANWNGTLDSPGFIICTNAVPAWIPNKDYLFGSLVQWKNNNYVATQDVIGAATFPYAQFQLISTVFTNTILPNLSLKSLDYLNAYNVNYRPFMTDFMNLRNNTVGYIERDWLAILDIDLGGQIDFYKGWIKEKGTLNSLNSYGRGSTPELNTVIAINEEYAMKVGVYGSDLRTGYGDVSLPPAINTQNPLVITFVSTPNPSDSNSIQVTPNNLYQKSSNWMNDFVQNYGNLQLETMSLVSAGPVIPQVLIDQAQATIPGFVKTDQPYLFFPNIASITAAPQDSILKIAENGGSFWIENNHLAPGPNQWDVLTFPSVSTGICSISQLNSNTICLILSSNIGAVANSAVVIDYRDFGANVSIQGAFVVNDYFIAPFETTNSIGYSNLTITTAPNQFGNVFVNYPSPVATSDIFVARSLRANSIAESQLISTDTTQYVVQDATGETGYSLNRPYPTEISYANVPNGVPINAIAYDSPNQLVWCGEELAVPNGIVELHVVGDQLTQSGNLLPTINTQVYSIQPETPYTSNLGATIAAANSVCAASAANIGGPGQIYIIESSPRKQPVITQVLCGDVLSTEYTVGDMAMSDDASWLYAVINQPSQVAIIAAYALQPGSSLTYPVTSITSNVSTDVITTGNIILSAESITVTVTNNLTSSTRTLIPNLEYQVLSNLIFVPTSIGANISDANYSTFVTSLNPYYLYQGNINLTDFGVFAFGPNDQFGASISCDATGTTLAVGAPASGNGNVVVFNRIIENNYTPVNIDTLTTANPFTTLTKVLMNGALAFPGASFNSSNVELFFGITPLNAASVVQVQGFCFSLEQIISAPNPQDVGFGTSLSIQNNQLVVGSTGTLVGSQYNKGAVYFYALDTSLTNTKIIPIADLTFSTDSFMINNWVVTPATPDLSGLLSAINGSTPYTGISASTQGSNITLSINPTFHTTGIGILGA